MDISPQARSRPAVFIYVLCHHDLAGMKRQLALTRANKSSPGSHSSMFSAEHRRVIVPAKGGSAIFKAPRECRKGIDNHLCTLDLADRRWRHVSCHLANRSTSIQRRSNAFKSIIQCSGIDLSIVLLYQGLRSIDIDTVLVSCESEYRNNHGVGFLR
jgi:hypothetical protein